MEQPEVLLEEIEEIYDAKGYPYLELFRSVFFYKPPFEESMAVSLEKSLEDFIFNKNNDAMSDIYFLLCASLDGLAVLSMVVKKACEFQYNAVERTVHLFNLKQHNWYLLHYLICFPEV